MHVAKQDAKEMLLQKLKKWHEERGIVDFPKRYGITTNEKKFREFSFRIADGIKLEEASVESIITNCVPITVVGNKIVGYNVTYNAWFPSSEGRKPGVITIRFNLYPGIVGLLKINHFFVAMEHDCLPIQKKLIGVARMFGQSDTNDLKELAEKLIHKEYPFFLPHIKSYKVKQLGDFVFQDPSSRHEKTIFLLIDLDLGFEAISKEQISQIIDHRNSEMLLHHIFSEQELREIIVNRSKLIDVYNYISKDINLFLDNYSLHALQTYFLNF